MQGNFLAKVQKAGDFGDFVNAEQHTSMSGCIPGTG